MPTSANSSTATLTRSQADPAEIEAIRLRANAATSGPWRWSGNMEFEDPRLTSPGYDVLGHVPRDRTMNDREAQVRTSYFVETGQVFDTEDLTFRGMTEAEAAEDTRDNWLLDQDGEVRTDSRLAFVNDFLYVPARDLAVFEVCRDAVTLDDPRVYRADIVDIRHPDADFIAHSRQDVETLLAEIDRLRDLVSTLTP